MPKKSKPNITVIGGGSLIWGPRLLNDFILTPELNGEEYVLLDIKREAAERIKKYRIERISVQQRRERYADLAKTVERYISGEESLAEERSREPVACIIAEHLAGGTYYDVVNLPNTGQIDNLPRLYILTPKSSFSPQRRDLQEIGRWEGRCWRPTEGISPNASTDAVVPKRIARGSGL